MIDAKNAAENTILVFESDAGVASHCFCTEEFAKAKLSSARDVNSGGSMFTSEADNAELIYSVSPDMQNRVAAAKEKLNRDITIRNALNKQGVPADVNLRVAIYKAIHELSKTGIAI
jgi:hypothetical protein